MAPRGHQIPNGQRCRHMLAPLRRCGRYAETLNGAMKNGYCWQHQRVGGWIRRSEAETLVLDMMTPPEPPAAAPADPDAGGVG